MFPPGHLPLLLEMQTLKTHSPTSPLSPEAIFLLPPPVFYYPAHVKTVPVKHLYLAPTHTLLVLKVCCCSEVHGLNEPLEFLPSCDGFGEDGLHYALTPEVHGGGGRGLSFSAFLCSRDWISWAGQRGDQVHLSERKCLYNCCGSKGRGDQSIFTLAQSELKYLKGFSETVTHFAVRLLGFLVLESPAAFTTST